MELCWSNKYLVAAELSLQRPIWHGNSQRMSNTCFYLLSTGVAQYSWFANGNEHTHHSLTKDAIRFRFSAWSMSSRSSSGNHLASGSLGLHMEAMVEALPPELLAFEDRSTELVPDEGEWGILPTSRTTIVSRLENFKIRAALSWVSG